MHSIIHIVSHVQNVRKSLFCRGDLCKPLILYVDATPIQTLQTDFYPVRMRKGVK
jgi:hypothetical protein